MNAAAIFDSPAECSSLNDTGIRWLLDRGVSARSLSMPWAIRAGRGSFDLDGTYSPSSMGQFVYLIGVTEVAVDLSEGLRDERLIFDVVAWAPKTGRVASRFGLAAMLGEEHLNDRDVGRTGIGLQVWRDPLGWLRAGRKGVVVVDFDKAAHLLSGMTLSGEDEAHDAELRQRLLVRPPVFVRRHQGVDGTQRRAA